jgi:hypothetical protein
VKTIIRNRRCVLFVFLVFFTACASTKVLSTHPSVIQESDGNAAKVYFMRPDIGYHNVTVRPFTILLNDRELLYLVKGEYTLVYVHPVSGSLKVKSWTGRKFITNQSRYGDMMVEESIPCMFETGKVYYIAFKENTQKDYDDEISYIPILISEDAAERLAGETRPEGRAINEPIMQRR